MVHSGLVNNYLDIIFVKKNNARIIFACKKFTGTDKKLILPVLFLLGKILPVIFSLAKLVPVKLLLVKIIPT